MDNATRAKMVAGAVVHGVTAAAASVEGGG